MEDLKRAYELLGVSEEADKEEIENRYFLLLRRHKSKAGKDSEEERRFEEITKAYQLIKAHLQQKTLESNPVYQADQKKSPFQRKLEHFLMYYKFHLIGGVLAAVLIGSFVYSMVTKEKEIPADVSTMMVGAYYADDFNPLEEKMTELVPEWQRVKVIINFTPNESMGAFDAALLQKSIVLLATERPDIYIPDSWQFERLGHQEAFLPLDEWEDTLRSLFGEERLMYARFANDADRKLYGIDLKDHPVFSGIMLDDFPKIFSIRSGLEDTTKAMRLITALGESLKP